MYHEPYTVHKTVEKLKFQAFFEVHIHVFICKFDNVQSYSIVLIYCILYLCNFKNNYSETITTIQTITKLVKIIMICNRFIHKPVNISLLQPCN